MEKVIIAVDAGGTKTKICAINAQKHIVHEIIGEAGSPAVLGEKAIYAIFQYVHQLYDSIKDYYEICHVQMGISGLSVVPNKKKYEDQLAKELQTTVSMETDVVLALYSIVGLDYEQGVVVLSGTGSATYGINKEKAKLIGGTGHLLSETGSSYASVRQLVVQSMKAMDEEGELFPLALKFMSLIGIEDVNDFKVFMYSKTKGEIAQFAQFISEEAMAGDIDAKAILEKSAKDLAYSVKLLYKHLALDNRCVLGFRGSFIHHAYKVKEEFYKQMQEYELFPNYIAGEDDPVYGAYYMAKRRNIL